MDIAFADLDRDTTAAHVDRLIAVADDVPGEYWGPSHFLLELPEKWELSFAAWSGVELAGYAILSRPEPDRVHLHHLMVNARYRNGGLGRSMVEEMERRARAAGGSRLTLKVDRGNAGAIRFYERIDYRRVGEERGFLTLEKSVAARP